MGIHFAVKPALVAFRPTASGASATPRVVVGDYFAIERARRSAGLVAWTVYVAAGSVKEQGGERGGYSLGNG